MKKAGFNIMVLFAIIIAPSAYGDEAFLNVKSLKCKFQETYFTSFNQKNEVTTEKNMDLFEVVFDSINRKTGKGRIIGNAGTDDVTIMNTGDVMHIEEMTPSGNLNIVTVYNHPMPQKGYFAVYSRHVGNKDIPMISYMIGTCANFN